MRKQTKLKPCLLFLCSVIFPLIIMTCSSAPVIPVESEIVTVPLGNYVATSIPSDPLASSDSKKVLAYLADFSNGVRDGVLVGQNTGHGSQILDTSGYVGYGTLVDSLERQTGQVPAIIGLDYEHDLIFTPAQLAAANAVLIKHAKSAHHGLVTINWSPHSPWLNDETDIVGHPGIWSNTRTQGQDMSKVDLNKLINPANPISVVWLRKLDRVATALKELQDNGVVVLWRPMQEMDGDWFWWGISTAPNDPSSYINLWRHMYNYFTVTKGLHNLLWVFSPAFAGSYPVAGRYPGGAYVDIVAGTTYQDQLNISRYAELQVFNKVVGMAELGPQTWRYNGGAFSLNGTFDNRVYVRRLINNYPSAAYWVSWHNWSNGDGTSEHQAIVSNHYASELMQDTRAITLERLEWQP